MRFVHSIILGLLFAVSVSHVAIAQDAAIVDAPVETESSSTTTATSSSDETNNEPVVESTKPDEAINTCEANVSTDNEDVTKEEDKIAESETQSKATPKEEEVPKQAGPFIDLFGEKLISLKMVDETHAQIETHLTNEALAGKKVIGVYFSAE